MDIWFVLAQILAIVAFVLTTISLQFKKKSGLLAMQIASNVAYTLQYICLGALTGAISFIIGTIRNITYYIFEKKGYKPNVMVLSIFIILILLVGIFTYENLNSLLPMFALIIWTILCWQNNPKWMRIGEACICVMWILYDVYVGAYTAIVTEVIIFISSMIGILRDDIKKNKIENQAESK